MKVEILYLSGCPDRLRASDLVREVFREEGRRVDIEEIEVRTPEQAQAIGFLGSPSMRIDGLDVEPEARQVTTSALGCRIYFHDGGRSGTPSAAMIRRAIDEQTAVSPNRVAD